jgi:ATP-dependent helicase/nuclease subunit B
MPAERHFLGWDAPVTAKVRDSLLPPALSGPVDLEKDLIIVPTAQAGRRLRETLALYCAERNTALLSPQVVEPIFFLRAADESTNVANQTEVAATWADVLMKTDISQYAGLFPARIPHQDFTWATHTAEMVQRLRDTLADGGRRITEVYQDFGSVLEEQDRWHDLAELETIYLERLNQLGLEDPYEHMIKRAGANSCSCSP